MPDRFGMPTFDESMSINYRRETVEGKTYWTPKVEPKLLIAAPPQPPETHFIPRQVLKIKPPDDPQLDTVVQAVIADNHKAVQDYRGGQKKSMNFLVGQVLKRYKNAHPDQARERLEVEINNGPVQ